MAHYWPEDVHIPKEGLKISVPLRFDGGGGRWVGGGKISTKE